jgi:heterodisulfide reductase subunit B
MPVLYFTQLMGLAFGHEAAELGLGKEFVNAKPALAKIGVDIPEEKAKKRPSRRRRRKDDPSLPMPHMPQDEPQDEASGEEEAQ